MESKEQDNIPIQGKIISLLKPKVNVQNIKLRVTLTKHKQRISQNVQVRKSYLQKSLSVYDLK